MHRVEVENHIERYIKYKLAFWGAAALKACKWTLTAIATGCILAIMLNHCSDHYGTLDKINLVKNTTTCYSGASRRYSQDIEILRIGYYDAAIVDKYIHSVEKILYVNKALCIIVIGCWLGVKMMRYARKKLLHIVDVYECNM